MKGIRKTVRVKRVWDEGKQDWVNRWERDGKNKEIEQPWITEVPANAGKFISCPNLIYVLTFFWGGNQTLITTHEKFLERIG